MYNARSIFNIFYYRPSNRNISHSKNEVRGIASRTAKGIEQARQAIAEIERSGYAVKHIYTGIGRKVYI